MKQFAVLSGKGGTGKSSLTACFAILAKNAVVVDCDVDAPDLHMLLHPQVLQTQAFKGSKVAQIDQEKCTKCRLCQSLCKFNAIVDGIAIDPFSCEGCGVCGLMCPAGAIRLVDRTSGSVFISKTTHGFMSHGLLDPGESNSGKLVTIVRQNAKAIATKENLDLILIDGPPGIGCPVIASISGVDAALIVTEPTLSGIHDLTRVLDLLNHFSIKPYVCVNMFDLNIDNTEKIESFSKENGIEVIGTVPFDHKVTEAMVNGKTIIDYAPSSKSAQEIETIWETLNLRLKLHL